MCGQLEGLTDVIMKNILNRTLASRFLIIFFKSLDYHRAKRATSLLLRRTGGKRSTCLLKGLCIYLQVRAFASTCYSVWGFIEFYLAGL